MKYLIGILIVLIVSFSCMVTKSENTIQDDAGGKSLMVEDSTSPGVSIRVKGDPLTGGILVSGIGSSNCTWDELPKKADISAGLTSGNSLNPTTAAEKAIIINESVYNIYWAATNTVLATTGQLIPPLGGIAFSGSDITDVGIRSGGAATSTVSVSYCR